ncbi:MAG: purine-nucleoside phosphorylase [Sphaerochaetaceae bacterium]
MYQYSLDFYQKSADYLKSRIDFTPEIGIILGSGLAPFARQIENPVVIPYEDIPNFLISTVASHAGNMILGQVEGKNVICMSGRFHFYEGYDFEQLNIPIRVMKLLGVKKMLATNAAGAVNTGYKPGDVMIISDHIKFFQGSPMRGPNVPEFGQRFFDISDMYSEELRTIARTCARTCKLRVHEGVYMFFPGPQFESPAEIRAARILGADAVGMSTVTEALTAAHCNMPLLGLSVVTNMASGVQMGPVTSEEVTLTSQAIADDFSHYVKSIIKKF